MTTNSSDFIETNPISYTGKEAGEKVVISPRDVAKVVVGANEYLHTLGNLFGELHFDIFATLGQRDLSGFIGEVFSHVFSKNVEGFVINPHADGRPDLLDIRSAKAREHFRLNCFDRSEDGTLAPVRSQLAPFKYGGLEVKSTIGTPDGNYRTRLQSELGLNDFSVGVPRVNYLASITYWGHHASCGNLLGLYYDYSDEVDGSPQIMAVMHAELDPAVDWRPVSIGKLGSKKTSNTSLSASGCAKVMANPVVVRNHPVYLKRLCQIGLKIDCGV